MSKDAVDRQVDTIFRQRCSGIAIDILDIPRVFAVGRQAHANGQDVEATVVAFVESVRKN